MKRFSQSVQGMMRAYGQSESGQFALIVAFLALPMTVLTGVVLEHTQSTQVRADLKSALDTTALATVTNQRLLNTERGAYAQSVFEDNFKYSDDFTLRIVKNTREKIKLEAEGTIPTYLTSIVGRDTVRLSDKATAIRTEDDVICVMTLNPDGKESFVVKDGADFHANRCSVQVNSNHLTAAKVDFSSTASAKSFCVAGGAQGLFTPYVNTECRQVEDPYAHIVPPATPTCVRGKKGKKKKNGLLDNVTDTVDTTVDSTLDTVSDLLGTENVIGDNERLLPGAYCGGMEIEGKNIYLAPGAYVIVDGDLKVKKGSHATGEGVTFIMLGSKGALKIEDGSSLTVTAPKTGVMAGLAFYQDNVNPGGRGKGGSKLPYGKSELKGGASLSVTGTIYLPTHELFVGGESQFASSAPATSYIGYNVTFEDNSVTRISADHRMAGLPPLLPRSDSGARLIE